MQVSKPLISAMTLGLGVLASVHEVTRSELITVVFALFGLGMVAVQHQVETRFVLAGYMLWVASYVYQIYSMLLYKQSAWPIVAGGYYLQNEFVVSFTKLFDSPCKHQYETPIVVRLGYRVFFALDLVLSALTVYYGTGLDMDEFGLLPCRTVSERTVAFMSWFSLSFLATMVTLRTGDARQAKYWCYAIHFVAHSLILRLPQHSSANREFNVKLQIFANACFAARYASDTLPEPKWLYRALMFAMPLFSILTMQFHHHDELSWDVTEWTVADTRLGSALWLGGVWIAVVALTNQNPVVNWLFSKHFTAPT
ncbi:hypothetical protein BASA81_009129 [Batrachochytrium salamandrivorans]|nr:hypothetical protein BASA81_009129 [Batrachochytrium salamandrivorans]